ncbi:MAG: TIGR00282 family metallophosphoesterase [Deltaproteobacteria bacterium]
MKVLFIGDIIGNPGRKAVSSLLNGLVDRNNLDMVVANGENSAGGFGITPEIAEELFGLGIHVITTGNHIWDKKEIIPYIPRQKMLLRPANYPPGVPGCGSVVVSAPSGENLGIINVNGRVFMDALLDCPFRGVDAELEKMKGKTKAVLVDIHAEATSEKMTMGWHLDGRVSAVVGTHTHVQTADERILPKGTAFISDVGMTGPLDSSIGIDKSQALEKFLTQMPRKFDIPKNDIELNGVIIDIDAESGLSRSISRVKMKLDKAE